MHKKSVVCFVFIFITENPLVHRKATIHVDDMISDFTGPLKSTIADLRSSTVRCDGAYVKDSGEGYGTVIDRTADGRNNCYHSNCRFLRPLSSTVGFTREPVD